MMYGAQRKHLHRVYIYIEMNISFICQLEYSQYIRLNQNINILSNSQNIASNIRSNLLA